MAQKKRVDSAKYILGFDGGGTKTECLLGLAMKSSDGPLAPPASSPTQKEMCSHVP